MSMTRSISRSLLYLLVTSVALGLLAGCGGGAGGGGGGGPAGGTSATGAAAAGGAAAAAGAAGAGASATPAAAAIQLLGSSLLGTSLNLPSSGTGTLDVMATVTDSSSRVIAGKAVTFSVTDPAPPAAATTAPKAFLTKITNGGVTDANGGVTATLNLGTNKTNRTIRVTATADSFSTFLDVTVSGTSIAVPASVTLTTGSTTTLTVRVTDSAGSAISGADVTVSSCPAAPSVACSPPNPLTSATAPTTGTACPLAASCGKTDSSGNFTFTVTGIVTAADTITVSAQGATKTFTVTVGGTTFLFITPPPVAAPFTLRATGVEVPVVLAGALPPPAACPGPAATNPQCLTAHFDIAPFGAQPVAITFTATRGVFSTGTSTTTVVANAAGNATAVIASTTSGPSTVSATATSTPGSGSVAVSKSIDQLFVATTATKVTAQATQSTVAANLIGTSSNTTTITAVVRDAANNLAKNARVNFSITSDPTGGFLSAPSDVTDASGVAKVTYTAGSTTCCGPSPSPSPVTISATVVNITVGGVVTVLAAPQPTSLVNLTVGGRPLFVRLGTDNKIGSSGLTYQKSFVALVTDAAGNPVPDASVQFTVRPRQDTGAAAFAYFKGVRIFCAKTNPPTVPPSAGNPAACGGNVTVASWIPIVAASCKTEDTNFNGILDVGPPTEDINGDGLLTPGNIASVNKDAKTDSNGFATAVVAYAKDFADWAAVTLVATASVSGTESTSTATFTLPFLTADVTDPANFPPGQFSPFGQGGPILEEPDLTITGATNAAPIVITTATVHGFATGQQVTISGLTGNTAANGTFTITVLTTTTFSLNGSSGVGFPAFVAASGVPTCTDTR